MQSYLLKKIVILVFWLVFFGVPIAIADNSKVKLKNVLQEIKQVKTDLRRKEEQQISVREQLQHLRRKISSFEGHLTATTKKLQQQKKILLKLNQDQARAQNKLQDVEDQLSCQINLAYQIAASHYFKTIFAQTRSVTPELLLTYHKYIFMARLEQLRNINKTLVYLARNRQQINQQTKSLEKLETKQQQQKLELEQVKEEQNKVFGSLKNKIAFQHQQLKQLLAAKKNLEKLTNQLTQRSTITVSPELRLRLCKEFIWPTKGVIITRFGSAIAQSSWKWNGVIIRAVEKPRDSRYCIGKGGIFILVSRLWITTNY